MLGNAPRTGFIGFALGGRQRFLPLENLNLLIVSILGVAEMQDAKRVKKNEKVVDDDEPDDWYAVVALLQD